MVASAMSFYVVNFKIRHLTINLSSDLKHPMHDDFSDVEDYPLFSWIGKIFQNLSPISLHIVRYPDDKSHKLFLTTNLIQSSREI